MHPRNHTLLALAAMLLVCGSISYGAELKLLSQDLPKESYTTDKPNDKSGPDKAFDGRWKGTATAWCNGPAYPTWLMVDLGESYNIIKCMTYMEKPSAWYSYRIEVSPDKENWTPFTDQTKNREPSEDEAYTDMGMVTGRYVRITLTDVADRKKNWYWPVIREFQVYGVKPKAP